MIMTTPGSPSRTAVVAPSLLVSLAATPWLAAIVSARAASDLIEQLGLASEEIFRGDRLPVLHFPDRPSDAPIDPTTIVD
jgi:hypothetical protein